MRAVVTVRTLDHSVHSGMYGGAAVDAVTALVRLLASLHDDDGSVAVAGLDAGEAADLDYDEARFREESGLLDGVDLIGTGSILSRLWTKPSITTIGIDATSIDKASNTLAASAAAKISVRLAPTQDPAAAFELVKAHLESHAPWGARVEVALEESGPGFAADADGPVYDEARASFADAWGADPVDIGVGGSIPFIAELRRALPGGGDHRHRRRGPRHAGPRRQRVAAPRRVREGLRGRGGLPRPDGRTCPPDLSPGDPCRPVARGLATPCGLANEVPRECLRRVRDGRAAVELLAQLEGVGLDVRHAELAGDRDLGLDVVGHAHEGDRHRRPAAGTAESISPSRMT